MYKQITTRDGETLTRYITDAHYARAMYKLAFHHSSERIISMMSYGKGDAIIHWETQSGHSVSTCFECVSDATEEVMEEALEALNDVNNATCPEEWRWAKGYYSKAKSQLTEAQKAEIEALE